MSDRYETVEDIIEDRERLQTRVVGLEAQVRLLQESVVKAREEAYRMGQTKIVKLLAPAFYDALFHAAPEVA